MAILFAFAASGVSLGLYKLKPAFLEYIDQRASDAVFELRADADALSFRELPPPPSEIMTVVVDEKAVNQHGRWPWPRELHAKLIRRLKDFGVSAIGLDIVYPQSSNARDDALLADAIMAPGADVVGGYFFRKEKGIPPVREAMSWFEKQGIGTLLETPDSDRDKVGRYSDLEINAGQFARHMQGQGFFNSEPDRDGLIRRAPLILRYGDGFYPSLPLLTLSRYLKKPIAIKLDATGIAEVRLGNRRIPVDGNGDLPLNFYNSGDLVQISAADVLTGNVFAEAFRNRIVFIGVTEVGIADVRPTPVDNSFPGVLVHTTIAGNIFQERYLKKNVTTQLIEFIIISLLPLLMIIAMARFRSSIVISLIFLATAAVTLSICYWLVAQYSLNVSFVYPTIALALGFFMFQTFHMLVHQRHSDGRIHKTDVKAVLRDQPITN